MSAYLTNIKCYQVNKLIFLNLPNCLILMPFQTLGAIAQLVTHLHGMQTLKTTKSNEVKGILANRKTNNAHNVAQL
tara:strand:+ start:230 stop:457 length:228 start_codon:yes stop_codon:yes gene_type:complete